MRVATECEFGWHNMLVLLVHDKYNILHLKCFGSRKSIVSILIYFCKHKKKIELLIIKLDSIRLLNIGVLEST